MIFIEQHKDLFSVNSKEYIFAHCISSDCKMGAGIAVDFKKKFHLGGMINLPENILKHPTCVYHNGCFNLITKSKYYGKPTYYTLTKALELMRDVAYVKGIKKIAMPRIGCRLDKLVWPKVRNIIQEVFEGSDITILVCYK